MEKTKNQYNFISQPILESTPNPLDQTIKNIDRQRRRLNRSINLLTQRNGLSPAVVEHYRADTFSDFGTNEAFEFLNAQKSYILKLKKNLKILGKIPHRSKRSSGRLQSVFDPDYHCRKRKLVIQESIPEKSEEEQQEQSERIPPKVASAET